jgi:CheY-like chemotaxis protein
VVCLAHEMPGLVMGIYQDITAQRQTEEALRKAQEAAQSTDRAKTAFLANMSHEIRTPMNTIMGMTHLALEDTQPEKHRSYVAKAHQAAKSMLQIINDVMDLSRIEAGQLELECIEFPVQGLIDQLSNVLGLQAEQKGIELLFTAPMDLPTHLLGDPTRVRQILLHLGANAIKHTTQGSVTLGLEVRSRHGYEVELHGWVRDTGEGMTAEQQARLMQSFGPMLDEPPSPVGGAGLSLTICHELLERMAGRLWVEGALGQGCTFHFTFKISLPSGPAHTIQVQDTWEGRRVLLADDNPDAREVLGKMLAGMGLLVDMATNGTEALALLARSSRPYDWIMLDWKMPGMDGIRCAQEAQSQLQQRFPGTQPCILLVTAFNRDDALDAAHQVPLAGVLTKPITPTSLADCLRKTVTVRSLARPAQAAPAEPAPTSSPQHSQLLAGTHILLVEDQPLNQEIARELLQLAGATVVCAENGALALTALARNNPFDCVLMDCQMPVMDGYTATRKIRQQPQWQHLPIIAMTASALDSDREHALSSGMNDHITKPLDIDQMYQAIGKWVAAARALKREEELRKGSGRTH